MRGTQNLNKNSIINIHREEDFYISFKVLNSKIPREGSYQTFLENPNNSKIPRGGSYQISPENPNNFKIPEEGSYQTSPGNPSNNFRISEESFPISLSISTPVDCKEGSYQTSIR